MKVFVGVVLLLLVGCAFCEVQYGNLDEYQRMKLFHEFISKYEKNYASDSILMKKFDVFSANLDRIDGLNSVHDNAEFGVNKFSDLTQEEFAEYYLGTHPVIDPSVPTAPLASKDKVNALPKDFDWRSKGAVTPVKNQGQCGSCWAFSTTGNVEGQHFLATGHLVGLSEQNLVDCDHECMQYDGQKSCDAGCDGGLQPNAYRYIISNHGIDTEKSYPYHAQDGTCEFKAADVGATINNYTMVSKDEDQMAVYMYDHGPVAIAADAVEWQFYIGGVFDGPCGTSLDHGILITGFGEEVDDFGYKIKYWWVKNSWGSDWGISGYMKIIRGVGECGLNLFVSSAIINK